MLYVVKRDGRKVRFNSEKIGNAIKKAANEVGDNLKESSALELIQKVIIYIEELEKENITVEEIQNLVEWALVDKGYEKIQ